MRSRFSACLAAMLLTAALAEDPPEVTFSIATKHGRTRFQMGEAVDVEFSFRTSTPGKYRLIAILDKRDVRIPMYDQFIVEPREDVVDPLGDIPAQRATGVGSLAPWPFLSSNAVIVERQVNEWISFRKPGKYRITAETKRVMPAGQASAPLSLRSNSIEVEIVEPEAGWAAAQLSVAVSALERGDPPSVIGQPYDDRREAEIEQAGRILRFLGTPEAVPALARFFENGPRMAQRDLRAGLFGPLHRKQVIAAMEEAVAAPDVPVTYYYLATLMELAAADALGPQPLFPVNDPEAQKRWMEVHRSYLKQSRPVETHYFDVLAGAIARKQSRALAVSLETMLTRGPQPPSSATRAALIENFQALPEMTQSGLLETEWHRLASPAIEPFVRSLAEGVGPARNVALLRLLDLNRAAARTLAIERIRKGDTGGGEHDGIGALLLLPDKTLPELDEALIDALEQDKPVEILVARYASAGALSRVRAWYERGPNPGGRPRPPCGGAILAYFFRVDPVYAADRLASSRRSDQNRCPLNMSPYEDLLMSPGLEGAAINDLASSSPLVQRAAQNLLRAGGSRGAEQPLWEGLARPRGTSSSPLGPIVESGFVEALLQGNGWVLTPEKLDRLASSCLSDNCRSFVTSERRGLEPPIHISFGLLPGGSCPIHVGTFQTRSLKQFEDKISQFPRGTRFRLYPAYGGTWFGDQLASQVRSVLKAAAMTLEEAPAARRSEGEMGSREHVPHEP